MKRETPERYLANAKETLAKAGIEDKRYVDMKYVKVACGTAYLGILKAIDEYLLRYGVSEDKLPKKVEEYQKALKKYSAHNGKTLGQFNALYHELHIAGYYRGDLQLVDTVKASLKGAKDFVAKLT
ncbi:MAG: DUF5618 family protein [Nitrospirae bacterium]|nr:DUF5618 family protein [Nitrospirota bacterium]